MSQKFGAFIRLLAYILLITFCLRCAISWNDLIYSFSFYDLFSFFSEAIAITTAFGVAYERWIWKLFPSKSTPKLKPNYIGSISPKNSESKYPARLEIQQTLFSIKIALFTSESYSISVLADIQEHGTFKRIFYSYENRPLATVRDRSPSHTGTAILRIDSPDLLIGDYFTDRLSSGDLYFTSVLKSSRNEEEEDYIHKV